MTFARLALRVCFSGMTLAWCGHLARAEAVPEAPVVPRSPIPATLTARGVCPAVETIWADVKAIVPASDLPRVTSTAIEVTDLGVSYRVRILVVGGERLRVFMDLERDCDHRARFAAVFIVLTLIPPDVLLDARPEAPPPPPPATAPPRPLLRSPRFLRLDLSALLDWAPPVGATTQTAAIGGELRTSWGARPVVFVAGVGLEPRATFRFGSVEVDQLRAPIDVGAAIVSVRSRATFIGEASLAGAVLRISGANTSEPQSGTRLDLGARVAVAVRIGRPSAALAPILGVHALFFPKPYEVTAIPQGTLGRLPGFWIGATAGLSFSR
jgi:hypothetical protein